jgi:polyisoprenoid-binding protein YceI
MESKNKIVIAAVAALVLVIGGGAAFFLTRDDAPDEVDLETAVGAIADNTTTTAAPGDTDQTTTTAADGDVSGTWTVDTETGEFDYESATGTFAGFRIDEELAGIGAVEAVGRTGDVSGTVEIDGTTVTAAEFTVDMTTLTTNDSRRDNKVQQALETGEFPTATFELTEPIDLGAGAADGEAVQVNGIGDLTIHGVTKEVELPIQAQLTNGTVVLVVSTDITFADYDVEVPSAPIVVSVSDTGTLELQLLLTRS